MIYSKGLILFVCINVIYSFESKRLPRQSSTNSTTNLNKTSEDVTPYPESGFRPGRAFPLPSEIITTTENIVETTTISMTEEEGPYPPLGWKPQGRSFELPQEEKIEKNIPSVKYGPPTTSAPIYLPPSNRYLPSKNQTEIDETNENDIDNVNADQPAQQDPVVLPQYGFYYVQLPNGLLQKVYYRSDNVLLSGLPANLQAQERKPLKLVEPQTENIVYMNQYRQFWGRIF